MSLILLRFAKLAPREVEDDGAILALESPTRVVLGVALRLPLLLRRFLIFVL